MASIFSPNTPNYSLLAIPAYYIISFVPHLYAGSLLKAAHEAVAKDPAKKVKSGQNLYNLPNPRAASNSEYYAKYLDRSTFQRWERTRAAHNNLLENGYYLAAAILAGIVTKLDAEYMNKCAAIVLGARVLYIISYIGVERGLAAFGRTLWFLVGNIALTSIFWESAKVVMDGKY